MKLFNILFLAIKASEYEFLKYRHEIDSVLFSFFSSKTELRHLKLYEPHFFPQRAPHEFYFKGRNGFFHIPFKLIFYVRRHQPDVLLIHGFVFPVQLLSLLLMVKKRPKVIIQHHAEKPFANPVKHLFQKLAYAQADAYLFTSGDLAKAYLDLRIIPDKTKIHEVMEGSSQFKMLNKSQARELLDLASCSLFLWVGRLDVNKDPLLVLEAFKRYKNMGHDFKLYMIYSGNELELRVKKYLVDNALTDCVHLVGKVPHTELESWYNAADYFVSASHYEGGGIAMCEAMSCGCIPIVTAIPSFIKMTGNGRVGYLYEPGNVDALSEKLASLEHNNRAQMSINVRAQFENHLSLPAIGQSIEKIAASLLNK